MPRLCESTTALGGTGTETGTVRALHAVSVAALYVHAAGRPLIRRWRQSKQVSSMIDSRSDQQRQSKKKRKKQVLAERTDRWRCNIDVNNGRVAQVPGTVQDVQTARWSTVQVPAHAHVNARRPDRDTVLEIRYLTMESHAPCGDFWLVRPSSSLQFNDLLINKPNEQMDGAIRPLRPLSLAAAGWGARLSRRRRRCGRPHLHLGAPTTALNSTAFWWPSAGTSRPGLARSQRHVTAVGRPAD